jgi:hypothetical protein
MNTPQFRLRIAITLLFALLTPPVTYILLALKGLPTFAMTHQGEALLWAYSVTWVPALLAGLLLSGIVSQVIQKTDSFHKPYDFGRSFSLGAIGGALSEAVATAFYRAVSHRPFSDFWIAGATIAGCLIGAGVVSAILWRFSLKNKYHS